MVTFLIVTFRGKYSGSAVEVDVVVMVVDFRSVCRMCVCVLWKLIVSEVIGVWISVIF